MEFCVVDQGFYNDDSFFDQYGELMKDKNGKGGFGSEYSSTGVYRILPQKFY